jgi:hypothetical protein
MSARNIPLFDAAGRPTPFLQAQWRQREAAQPLQSRVPHLEADRTATPQFRTLWRVAFPLRQALPKEALADREGRGTDVFWDRLK